MDGLLTEEEELAARDIKRIAAREDTGAPSDGAIYAAVSQRDLTPEEREGIEKALSAAVGRIAEPAETLPGPFGQRQHELLLSSISHITHDWVNQLQQVRRNSEAVEQLVLERTAKLRNDITSLFALGKAVVQEAQRGDQVNAKLAQELEKMGEERAP
jgi:hypothetical protein